MSKATLRSNALLCLFLLWGAFAFWLYFGTNINRWVKHAVFVVGVIVIEGSFVAYRSERR